MARLFSSGFVTGQSGGAGDWGFNGVGTTNTVGIPRTGNFCGSLGGLVSGTAKYARTAVTATSGPLYARTYFKVQTLPTAENSFFQFSTGAVGTRCVGFTLDSLGFVRFYDSNGLIGTSATALALNQWYRIEMSYNAVPNSGARTAQAYLNGVIFASQFTGSFITGAANLVIGGNILSETQTQGTWYFDDIALNDSTGSSQTGLPGDGRILRYTPNAAGDNNMFTTQVGGTAGAANNYTRIDELQPDNATSYNADNTLNDIDDFKVGLQATYPPITSETIINVVHVNLVAAGAAASANASIVPRCKKTSSGTVAEGSAITPSSTSFTNYPHGNVPEPLTLYNDPDGNPWTNSTLSTAQIGYRVSTGNTNAVQVTNVWMLVDISSPIYPVELGGSTPNTFISKINNIVGY